MSDVEPVSGGLVTARDPSLLQPGELTEATDFCYIPGSPAVHRAPGRIHFNHDPLLIPTGLAYCGFDNAADLLVSLDNRTLKKADVEARTAWSTIGSQQGDTLDTVQYNDRHVLLTGGTPNAVLLPGGTIRQHGLQPVVDPPRIRIDTSGVGTWPLGAGSLPNTFEYWTTEVIKAGDEYIESTFAGKPIAATITNVTWYVEINRPSIVNSAATHWRVYRSAGHAAGISTFPAGYRIATLSINTTSFGDGLSVLAAATFPTAGVDGRRVGTSELTWGGNTTVSYTAWTTPGNVLANDAAYATCTSSLTMGASVPSAITLVELEATGFPVAGVNNPITRVGIVLKGFHSRSDGQLAVRLSWDGGLSWTASLYAYLGAAGPVTVALDQWNHQFTASELSTSTFIVSIDATNTLAGNVNHSLDSVSLEVTHSGSAAIGTLFPGATITVGGQSVTFGSRGAPPRATTGDIFQESLVLDDLDHPSQIAYSLPGDIDAFPAPYILNFQTKDKDRLACIRTLGSVCIFGLTSQVLRANYLPRSEDAEFDRGRCVEIVDADNGIPGRFAAARFVFNGRMTLFYVSRSGPRMTDGFSAGTANDDLDWPKLVNINQLHKAVVINNAERQEILVYCSPPGGFVLNQYLRFQYHASHIKDGKLKAIGPCGVSAVAATVGTSAIGERVLYTLAPSGFTYQENRGSHDESGVGIQPRLSTREIYGAGVGGEWQLNRAFIHHNDMFDSRINVNYTVTRSNSPERSSAVRVVNPGERSMTLLTPAEGGEGIALHMAFNDVAEDQVVNYLLLEGETISRAVPLANQR